MSTFLWILAVVCIPLMWGWLVQALLEWLWPGPEEADSAEHTPSGEAHVPDFQI